MKNNIATKQTPCKQCTYYFGKSSIHCGVHPYGREVDYCDDWQKVTLKQKVAMNIKLVADNISYPKAVAIVIAIASTITLGYGIKQNVPLAINALQRYDQYTQKCSMFLKRAGTAGTIGIAEPELGKAVSFLETNHLTQSFEYEDLKANLDYLTSQPDSSLMPTVIRDSISKNTIAIEKEENKKWQQSLGSLFSYQITISAILLAISIRIIRQESNY